MYEVRLVCEGPTDAEVLRAVLDAHLDDYVLTVLQPDTSLYAGQAGPHGGRWKGVRSWCRSVSAAGGFVKVGALTATTDVLVIHVDADIASDREVGGAMPCPPPQDTIQAVGAAVVRWLGNVVVPPNVVFWVPSKSTEAWLLRVFFPGDPLAASCCRHPTRADCVECIADPARALLQRRPRFVRIKQGKVKKVRSEYQKQRSALTRAWEDLVASCCSAYLLDEQLTSALS